MPNDVVNAGAVLLPHVRRYTFARTPGECISCRGASGDWELCDTCSARVLENAGRFLQRSVLCEMCGTNRGYWRTCDDCFARSRRRRSGASR
jgi:hypothetical protein